jgi:molybdopterin converting factor small subunit
MRVQVLLFAAAKQLAGAGEVEVQLSGETAPTIGDLRQTLRQDFPELAALLSVSAFAINSQWCADDATITMGSQVAMIPPVSGG